MIWIWGRQSGFIIPSLQQRYWGQVHDHFVLRLHKLANARPAL